MCVPRKNTNTVADMLPCPMGFLCEYLVANSVNMEVIMMSGLDGA